MNRPWRPDPGWLPGHFEQQPPLLEQPFLGSGAGAGVAAGACVALAKAACFCSSVSFSHLPAQGGQQNATFLPRHSRVTLGVTLAGSILPP